MNIFLQIILISLFSAIAFIGIILLRTVILYASYLWKKRKLDAMLRKKHEEQMVMKRREDEIADIERWFALHPKAKIYLTAEDRVKCRNCLNSRAYFFYYCFLNALKLCRTYLSFYVVHLRYKTAHLYLKLILFISKSSMAPECIKASCNFEANRIGHLFDFTHKPFVLKLSNYKKCLAEDNSYLLLAIQTFEAESAGLL